MNDEGLALPAAPRGEKYCARCAKTLPTDRFYRNRKQRDGLTGYCKTCWNVYMRARRKSVPREPLAPSGGPPADPLPIEPRAPDHRAAVVKPAVDPVAIRRDAYSRNREIDPTWHGYRVEVFRQARDALAGMGIDQDAAERIVQMIARRQIPRVRFDY